jgi:antitoxin component of MazEF toxin-antitoxin module
MVKVIKNGNALYVRVPSEVVKLSGLKQGQEVAIQYNSESELITIKKIE